ncbi:MAG: HAD-IA family hydrolase [Candidatus Amulumruptor caecigallinarius]|nr:HAD-IA family hydrolase [Candidatus Amulumruptor caecigallinarius]
MIFGKYKAALIDMDGVLYDSMPYHTLAWKRMMEDCGLKCERDEFYLYEGMTGVATINLLMQREFGKTLPESEARELYARKSCYFRELGDVKRMPNADRMLNALRAGGLKRVLVTGSAQSSLLDSLRRDYPGAFEEGMRVTALDVKHGKPDPEPYIIGAARAGVLPGEAIVVENAPLGVRAGKAAGCFTIAVTTGPVPREYFERENADMIFGSMTEFADFLENELTEK